MLKKLFIEQYVIIDQLDLDFESGLTILTGETGAGKSILLGAMGLILGEPSKPDSVRQGADQSVFEAVFAPKEGHEAWAFLGENGLLEGGKADFVIHRTMNRSGEDVLSVNGKPVTLEFLEHLGTLLVEIHGQFANQSLLGADNQLNLLDLSGAFPSEVFDNVSNALADVHRYMQELEDLQEFLKSYRTKEGRIEGLVERFDKIGMHETLVKDVEEEHEVLLIAKESSATLQSVLSQLIATNGAVNSLKAAHKTLMSNQENLEDDKIAKLVEHLSSALEHTNAAVDEMGILAPEYEIDVGPLENLQRVVKELGYLARETQAEPDGLFEQYQKLVETLDLLRNGSERVAELERLLEEAREAYQEHAQVLSEHRVEAAKALGTAITAEFAPLRLDKAQFEVVVEQDETMEWTDRGFDRVTFTARMNPGTPFSPISETASGGELARMILALKIVLERVQTTPTLVFDEVDTGIGGAAAAAVGKILAELAQNTQTLVITHSAQVASCGHQHLHISKGGDEQTTVSRVNELTIEQRIDEISRMLAGDAVTDESTAAAKRLLREAHGDSFLQ